MDQPDDACESQQRYYDSKVESLKLRRGVIEAKPPLDESDRANPPDRDDGEPPWDEPDPDARRRRMALYGLIASAVLAVLSVTYLWLHTSEPQDPAAAPTKLLVWASLDDPQFATLVRTSAAFSRETGFKVQVQALPDLHQTLPAALFAHIQPDVILAGRDFINHLASQGHLVSTGQDGYAAWLSVPDNPWVEPLGLAALRTDRSQAQREAALEYVTFAALSLTAGAPRR